MAKFVCYIFYMNVRSIFFLSFLLSFCTLQAQDNATVIRNIADEILVNGQAYENLRYLTKKIGPRLSGSIGAQKAVEATAAMLKDAGADTVYLQPCMVPHWVRGAREEGAVQYAAGKSYRLSLLALGNSVGTPKAGVKAKLVEVKSMQELHALGDKVKGKIVFFNIPMNPKYIRTGTAYGEAGIGRRAGPAQAAKYGAVAVVVRTLGSNIDSFPHTGVTQYNDSFPKIPAVAISTVNAEWLSARLKTGDVSSLYFKTNCQMLADVQSYNVIGEMRGSQFPEEIITVGGHLDSWDICEGAQDDGAGCVQSIEVINTLRVLGLRPKRTVRAVMFMNEENGARGAQAYLDAAREKKEHHIFALESDAGGFTPRGFGLDMPAEKIAKIQGWAALFYPYGVYDLSAGGSGTDVAPLRALGTPLAGLSPDSQRYFDIHHATNDVFEAVSKRELHLGAVNMTAMIWLVSEYGL